MYPLGFRISHVKAAGKTNYLTCKVMHPKGRKHGKAQCFQALSLSLSPPQGQSNALSSSLQGLCWWLLELLLLSVVTTKIEDLYFAVTIVLGFGLVTSIATVDDFYW